MSKVLAELRSTRGGIDFVRNLDARKSDLGVLTRFIGEGKGEGESFSRE